MRPEVNDRLQASVKKVYAMRHLHYQYASWVGGSIVIWALTPHIMNGLEALGMSQEKALFWIRLNLLCLPFFLLILLLVRTAWVYRQEIYKRVASFKPTFLKAWEERQIRKYLNSEE